MNIIKCNLDELVPSQKFKFSRIAVNQYQYFSKSNIIDLTTNEMVNIEITNPIYVELPEPKWKDESFKTLNAFNEWLDKTTKIIIEFDSPGDVSKLWLSEDNEILHADMQASIWNSGFIILHENSIYLYNKHEKNYRLMNWTLRNIINSK